MFIFPRPNVDINGIVWEPSFFILVCRSGLPKLSSLPPMYFLLAVFFAGYAFHFGKYLIIDTDL